MRKTKVLLVGVLGSVVAAGIGAANAGAAGVPAKIGSASTTLERGAPAFVGVSVQRAAFCRFEEHRAGRVQGIATRRIRVPGGRFIWRVRPTAASGQHVVAVRCATDRSLIGRARATRVTLWVTGTGLGTALVGRASLRFKQRPASSKSEGSFDLVGGLPPGDGDPLAVTPTEAPGTGGAGFGTFLPFATGSRVLLTQGPGGGTSHARTSTRYAVDFDVPIGVPLHAGFGGVVARTATGCAVGVYRCGGGFGNYVMLKHADGTCALHAHLSRVNVSYGQQIQKYTVIGNTGSTGWSTGPHLHYDRMTCGSFTSLPWAPAEGGPLRAGVVLVSQNFPDGPPPPPIPTTPPVTTSPGTPPVTASPGTPPITTTPPPPPPPRKVITVDNRVTSGLSMVEDSTPVRLTTQPWVFCGSRGCNIAGTERSSGGTYDAAVCQRTGERTTNGNDGSAADDANPLRFESTRYYGVRLSNGTFGYVSETWIRSADRGGLGLPGC